jgi:hypothetical protein
MHNMLKVCGTVLRTSSPTIWNYADSGRLTLLSFINIWLDYKYNFTEELRVASSSSLRQAC